MRIMSFSQKWGKLEQGIFSTFRFPRKDKDWWAGEVIRIVYKTRSPDREELGLAKILTVEPIWIKEPVYYFNEKHQCSFLSYGDARADGFEDPKAMIEYMRQFYGHRIYVEPMNKITIRWW